MVLPSAAAAAAAAEWAAMVVVVVVVVVWSGRVGVTPTEGTGAVRSSATATGAKFKSAATSRTAVTQRSGGGGDLGAWVGNVQHPDFMEALALPLISHLTAYYKCRLNQQGVTL